MRIALLIVCLLAACQQVARDIWAQEPVRNSLLELLPDSAGGYVRIVDMPTVCQAWQATSLGRLEQIPEMQPFFDSVNKNLEQELLSSGLRVGLRLKDLYEISSGEAVLGWLSHPDPRQPFTVLLITDISGRLENAEKAINVLDENMQAKDATRIESKHRDKIIITYTLPRVPGQIKVEQISVTYDTNRLIASSRVSTIQAALDAAAGESKERKLLDASDHAAVWQQVRPEGSNALHWFARPLAFARIMREIAGTDRGQRVDIVNLLERQGFAAVKSAGGEIRISENAIDLQHHGYIFAPQDPDGEPRFELAARALDFPNRSEVSIPAWVDPQASNVTFVNWRMEKAFWAIESLVDDAMGSVVFRPTLDGIRDDPEGAQIDIPNDIVANLGEVLFHLTDSLDGESDRTLVAIQVRNVEQVAGAINRAMQVEPNAEAYEAFPQHPVWKVLPETDQDLDDDLFSDFGFDDLDDDDDEERRQPLLEQWAITVVEDATAGGEGTGYLMFSSHAAQLAHVVQRIGQPQAGNFADDPSVQRVREQIRQWDSDSSAGARLNVTERSWRAKYETFRQGTLSDSDSVLGNLIRRIRQSRVDEAQPEKLNADNLPPFSVVRPYFTPAGGYVKTEENGWRIRGFLLGQ